MTRVVPIDQADTFATRDAAQLAAELDRSRRTLWQYDQVDLRKIDTELAHLRALSVETPARFTWAITLLTTQIEVLRIAIARECCEWFDNSAFEDIA